MPRIDRLSFEFFPPRSDEAAAKLAAVRERLEEAAPEFYSVTYGAGGSTRDRTLDQVLAIHGEGRSVAPHLSMGSDDPDAVRALVERYRDAGVSRVVALRGDVPSGMGGRGEVHYAEELVRLIREATGDHFTIEVAAYPEVHPEAASPEADLQHFAAKVAAGANEALTQYFYNADAYFDFRDRAAAAGVDVPIVPGIMPITNFANLVRFSDGCGAEIPRWVRTRLAAFEDGSEALKDFGADVVTALCERLLEGGAPGLHFYSMNQSRPSLTVLRRLGHLTD